MDDGTRGEVLALLVMGQKIEAIKLIRERTGLGLAEAKAAVEAIERGEAPPSLPPQAPWPGSASDAGDDELRALLAQGRKIEAIKRYRERTGLGLAEAKAAVEALQSGEAPPSAHAPVSSATVDELIRADRKIEAIKLVREQTGLGLREAKEQVERRAEELAVGADPTPPRKAARPRETPIPPAAPKRPWWKFWG